MIVEKIRNKFHCKKCDYHTSDKKDYNKHLMTAKHKNRTLLNILSEKSEKSEKHFTCECGKTYSARNSLWYHRKKCTFLKSIQCQDGTDEASHDVHDVDGIEDINNDGTLVKESETDTVFLKEMKHMFFEAMQQNRELQQTIITQQQQLSEVIPKVGGNTSIINNTTHNTTTNNQFNLNFFLNEQCKDAIPLIDFVKSLQYDFDQLEYTGKHGFVEGVSKIIMDAMNELDITKRPIHCTDVKRETFYVKDDESWKKEDERNRSIKTAIHNIRNRNLACVPEWIRAHPNCKKIDDPNNDLFIEIIGQYMDAAEKEFVKVIKTIAKSLTIPKSKYGRKTMCIVENSPII